MVTLILVGITSIVALIRRWVAVVIRVLVGVLWWLVWCVVCVSGGGVVWLMTGGRGSIILITTVPSSVSSCSCAVKAVLWDGAASWSSVVLYGGGYCFRYCHLVTTDVTKLTSLFEALNFFLYTVMVILSKND